MPAASPSRPTTLQANRLLRRYRSGSRSAKDELVLLYAPMVRYLAFKRVRELPPHCDVEDYIAAGMEALIAAVDRYDAAKGATFEQFAWTRVHGAIVDEMRRDDWAPRSVRRFARELDRASDKIASRDGRTPSDEDLAAMLDVSVDELRTKRGEVQGAEVVSLHAAQRGAERDAGTRMDALPDREQTADPLAFATAREAKARFRAAFQQLSQRDREVALNLYVANRTLREIGEDLGVTESRVCQIHGSIKKQIRTSLADHRALFDATG